MRAALVQGWHPSASLGLAAALGPGWEQPKDALPQGPWTSLISQQLRAILPCINAQQLQLLMDLSR